MQRRADLPTTGQENHGYSFSKAMTDFVPCLMLFFDNPQLEEEAIERCGDDSFCLFDVATTKRIEVGVSTMQESQSVDEEIELAAPSESSDSIVK